MTVSLLLFAAVLSADPVPKLPAQSAIAWPEFRGPTHEGHAGGPAPLSPSSDRVAWRASLPGLGWSSPVIDRGQALLTTAVETGGGHELRLLVVSLEDGTLKHNELVAEQPASDLVEMHQKNSHASPTPVLARIDDERTACFVHFGPHATARYSFGGDGSLTRDWLTKTPPYLSQHGTGGSPALVGTPDDGVLVLCCDGRDEQFVLGLEAASGRELWRVDREMNPQRGFSFGTPLLLPREGSEEGQVVCPGSSVVMSLDPRTGEEFWRVGYGSGYSVVPRPVFDADLGQHGLVFVCSGFGDKTIYAIDPSGRGDVTDSHVAWSSRKQTPMSPSLLLADGLLYAVADNGVASCWNAADGERVWTQRLGGGFSASPLLVREAGGQAGDEAEAPSTTDAIYWLSEQGELTVSRPGRQWQDVSRSRWGDGSRTFASPTVYEGDLLLRTESALLRLTR